MKTMTLLLVFLSCVGYSHTDEEKSRYVNGILEGALYVASDDNWSVEGRDPDPDNVLSTWEGFLGRPGGDSWVSGWSLVERRSAFDWYLATLATTNCLAFSSMDKRKVLLAFARCKRLCYTNAVPFLRGAALNPNCVHRDFAIEFSLELGRVDVPTTRFVETIVTNLSAFTRVERGIACGVYADKILNSSSLEATAVEVRNDALRSLYRNRMVDVAGVNMLDTLFVSSFAGYEFSSNRLEFARFVLTHPNRIEANTRKFTAITNQLLSSGRPLVQLTIGEGGNE